MNDSTKNNQHRRHQKKKTQLTRYNKNVEDKKETNFSELYDLYRITGACVCVLCM